MRYDNMFIISFILFLVLSVSAVAENKNLPKGRTDTDSMDTYFETTKSDIELKHVIAEFSRSMEAHTGSKVFTAPVTIVGTTRDDRAVILFCRVPGKGVDWGAAYSAGRPGEPNVLVITVPDAFVDMELRRFFGGNK